MDKEGRRGRTDPIVTRLNVKQRLASDLPRNVRSMLRVCNPTTRYSFRGQCQSQHSVLYPMPTGTPRISGPSFRRETTSRALDLMTELAPALRYKIRLFPVVIFAQSPLQIQVS